MVSPGLSSQVFDYLSNQNLLEHSQTFGKDGNEAISAFIPRTFTGSTYQEDSKNSKDLIRGDNFAN